MGEGPGTGLSEHRQFHTRFPTVSSKGWMNLLVYNRYPSQIKRFTSPMSHEATPSRFDRRLTRGRSHRQVRGKSQTLGYLDGHL